MVCSRNEQGPLRWQQRKPGLEGQGRTGRRDQRVEAQLISYTTSNFLLNEKRILQGFEHRADIIGYSILKALIWLLRSLESNMNVQEARMS